MYKAAYYVCVFDLNQEYVGKGGERSVELFGQPN